MTAGAAGRSTRRRSIVLMLLAAFLAVSLVPISVLAFLSWRESRLRAAHAEGEEPGIERETAGPMETLFGMPIAVIELAVAGASLGFSVLMAIYVGRTLIRPIRELESSMARVQTGDLSVTAPMRSDDELGLRIHERSWRSVLQGPLCLPSAEFLLSATGRHLWLLGDRISRRRVPGVA